MLDLVYQSVSGILKDISEPNVRAVKTRLECRATEIQQYPRLWLEVTADETFRVQGIAQRYQLYSLIKAACSDFVTCSIRTWY